MNIELFKFPWKLLHFLLPSLILWSGGFSAAGKKSMLRPFAASFIYYRAPNRTKIASQVARLGKIEAT